MWYQGDHWVKSRKDHWVAEELSDRDLERIIECGHGGH